MWVHFGEGPEINNPWSKGGGGGGAPIFFHAYGGGGESEFYLS